MSLHRFFASGPFAPSGVLPLSADDLHHLRDVLRLHAGEEIAVVVGGAASRVRLTGITPEVTGEVIGPIAGAELPRVTLVQGLAKGEKMDTVVRQTTEIGVSRVVPLIAARSVVHLEGAKADARTDRWRRIAAEAAKQSQRVDVPSVTAPVPLDRLGALLAESIILVCQEEDAGAAGIAVALEQAAPAPGVDVAVVVGPEGGLTSAEVTALVALGGTQVTLGETVLRTETAGVVATALVLHTLGALGARHA